MPYALYSHGKLLGETEFEYDTGTPNVRMGAFQPTMHGVTIMPILTGVQRAFRDLARKGPLLPVEAFDAQRRDRARMRIEFAELAVAESHFNALELELRSPEGVTLSSVWIGVQDTEDMLRFADEHRAQYADHFSAQEAQHEIDAALLHDLELDEELGEPDVPDTSWEVDEDRGEIPPFQIIAELRQSL